MRWLLIVFALSSAQAKEKTILERAADECARMPARLDLYGADCATRISARWTECEKLHAGHPAAFDDCLGFLRPDPIPTSYRAHLRLAPLRDWAISRCDKLPHAMRDCASEVAERFERCGPDILRSNDFDLKALIRCLGFQVPRKMRDLPNQMVGCEKPRVPISFKIARESEWPDSERRVIQDRTLYVAKKPIADERDVRAVTTTGGWGTRNALVQLTGEAALRKLLATQKNIGQLFVIETDGWILLDPITSGQAGWTISFPIDPVDLCR